MFGQPKHILTQSRGALVYIREEQVPTAPDRVFEVVESLGGKRGWRFANYLWRLRGAIDRALGGPGLTPSRRDPDELRVGDDVDFWRVEALRPPRFLRLKAMMKLPGLAWLQFEVEPIEGGDALLRSLAIFKPDGWLGRLYWAVMYPAHVFLFTGMLRAIAREAEARAAVPAKVLRLD